MLKKPNVYNIVLAGVGGAGIITATEILGGAAVKQNLKIRVGEIHGLAMRGGIVNTYIRIGEDVYSPIIMDGQADLLIGFELVEALRCAIKLSPKSFVILNDHVVIPPRVIRGCGSYPTREEVLKSIRAFTENVILIDALQLAKQAGHPLTMSTVLLGAAAAIDGFPVRVEMLREGLKDVLREQLLHENLKALELGYSYVKSKLRSLVERNENQ